MGTLIIKNVDLTKLEEQRKGLIDFYLSVSGQNDSVDAIINLLDEWSDQRYQASLGSAANQKAKAAQQDMFPVKWNVCQICGHETIHPRCPKCDGPTEPTDFVK